jgi:hypothetical protein
MNKGIVIIIVVIIVIAGVLLLNKPDMKETANLGTVTPSVIQKNDMQQQVAIDEIAIRLHIPREFIFSKQEQMNFTTNEPYAVSFTIQNYQDNPTEISKPYQLYGLYQWDTGVTTPEAFVESDFMLTESTREEFIVGGLPAIKGVSAGERGRYTIYILKDGHILSLAADGSDEEHIRITDEIVESIRFK